MATSPDIIIIGGGHNGLVAACYLAQAGLKVLVLERREIVGGIAVTEEIHPGFRCSAVVHSAGPLWPHVVKDLQLDRHGLEVIEPEVQVTALSREERPVSIYRDVARTASELREISAVDAKNYPEFVACFSRLGRVLAPLLIMTPPAIEKPSAGDLWNLGKLGMSFRGLDKKDAFRLLRWGPMAVADLAAEWFESELLRATVAARGIFGAFAGPWSSGTSAALLMQAAMNGQAISPTSFVKGGLGALTLALAKAATEAGAVVRTSEEVTRIQVTDSKATGVVLANGEEIPAWAIVSNADPGTTLLQLIDPGELEPGFLNKLGNYRAQGAVAKLNLALSALPNFTTLDRADEHAVARLAGRIHIGPEIDYLERAFDAAKYGDYSPHPYMDISIPSLTDSSLAPEGAHVMSIHVQFAPYKLKVGDWNSRSQEFADNVVKSLSDYAPNLKELIVGGQLITPLDLEQTYALRGGHIFHGEQTLDQMFAFRPLLGWAQYRTPIRGLYLCGAGTHPGGGVTGGPGANASREILKDWQKRT